MIARVRLLPEKRPPRDFESFFRREYPRLMRTLYLVTGSRVEAEDIAQEAMARTFERWRSVREMESPGGYACRTALNLNRKRLRGIGVRARAVLRVSTDADPMAAAEQRSDVTRALAALPLGQREALVLMEWLDLTADEAGALLGVEASSVRSQSSRARAALRRQLEANDG